MATNIRGTRVLMPERVHEYVQINANVPFGVIVFGVAMWVAGTLASIFSGNEGAALVLLLSLSLLVGGLLVYLGVQLALNAHDRLESISLDITPLRDVAVFDENAVSNENLWDAAGLAIQLVDLEEDSQRLAGARVRSLEQERELSDREYRMRDLAERISHLVT